VTQDANIVLKKKDCMGDFWQKISKFDFKVRNLFFSQVPIRYREAQSSRWCWKYTIQFWIASAQSIFWPFATHTLGTTV